MSEGLEHMYFENKNSVTAHKIHDKGKLFHQTHADAWNKIQGNLKNYHQMLNLYQKQTEYYMRNSNLPTGMNKDGLHQFVQLIPKNSYEPKTKGIISDDFNKHMSLNQYRFHMPLQNRADATAAAAGGDSGSGCDFTYETAENVASLTSCSNFINLGEHSFTKNQLSNMFAYFDKETIYQDDKKILHQCPTGKTCDDITTDKSKTFPLISTMATPNELHYAAYSSTAKSEDHTVVSDDNPFSSFALNANLNALKFQSYTTSTTEKPKYVPYKWMGETGTTTPTLLLKELTKAHVNNASVSDDKVKKELTVTIDTKPNKKLFKYVDGVVLKYKTIKDKISPSSTNVNKYTEYVQVYDTGPAGNDLWYVPVTNVPSITSDDFVNNNFAMDSIRLYAAVKDIEKTAAEGAAAEGTTDCGSISNPGGREIVVVGDDAKYQQIVATDAEAKSLKEKQPKRAKSLSGKKWCDVITAPKEDGAMLLNMHVIIQGVGRHIQREMFLFDLYQRGTVVTASSPFLDTSIVKADIDNEKYDEPPKEKNDNNQFIVFPKITGITTDKNTITTDICKESDYFNSNPNPCEPNYVLVPWTAGNLQALRKYSSGARFKGMTYNAYKRASDALMESYKTVEHDVKELNKIKALQTDVSILGNMQYYRMIIYAVVLFFLLVSVYYIHAAS